MLGEVNPFNILSLNQTSCISLIKLIFQNADRFIATRNVRSISLTDKILINILQPPY